jgi:hypothetical protein
MHTNKTLADIRARKSLIWVMACICKVIKYILNNYFSFVLEFQPKINFKIHLWANERVGKRLFCKNMHGEPANVDIGVSCVVAVGSDARVSNLVGVTVVIAIVNVIDVGNATLQSASKMLKFIAWGQCYDY